MLTAPPNEPQSAVLTKHEAKLPPLGIIIICVLQALLAAFLGAVNVFMLFILFTNSPFDANWWAGVVFAVASAGIAALLGWLVWGLWRLQRKAYRIELVLLLILILGELLRFRDNGNYSIGVVIYSLSVVLYLLWPAVRARFTAH